MAYGKGVNKTIIDSITPSTVLDPGLAGGQVKCFVDYYTGTGAEAGDTLTVEMGPELPVGAKILSVGIDCPATGITIDVGDAEDTDRYISAAAASQCSYCDNVTAALGYEIDMTTATTPDNQILMTLSGACNAVVVRLVVMYTVE
jgi:hypothetical protein